MRHLFVVLALGGLMAMGACSSDKERACEDLYDRIAKCMPDLAKDKDMHIKMCVARFDKDATKQSLICMHRTKTCDQFKECLKNPPKIEKKAKKAKAKKAKAKK